MAVKADKSLKNLPPFETYLQEIDAERVLLAIQDPEPGDKKRLRLAEYDTDDALKMVYVAAEKWLSRDIYDLDLFGVEEKYEEVIAFPRGGQQRVRGVFDIRATSKGRLNVTRKYAGQIVVIDWKTTLSTFDERWVNRYAESWQAKFYNYFANAAVVIYRGINRDGKTKEVFVEPPKNNAENCLVQLDGLSRQRHNLIEADLAVWPRRMPAACGEYGRECPYILECPDLADVPRGNIPLDKSFSFSSMDKFMQCPERYRRGVLDEDSGQKEGSDESDFGLAVHRGLAELYRQVMEKFKGN